jgi:hypothetical protein
MDAAAAWYVRGVKRSHAVVLREDPDLAERVPPDRLFDACRASVAVVEEPAPGPWAPASDRGEEAGGYGFLVLEGLLARRVRVQGRLAAELVAAGDILRPWPSTDEAATTFSCETTWQVLTSGRLAMLDRYWMHRMSPFPEVGAALVRRALERFERLLVTMSISAERRLEVRLWMLLWQLAERHGRVHPDGVHLDLRLTHELLARLTGAQRPSVSSALGRLDVEGKVRRAGGGWVLTGDPPFAAG